jgi:hypothetical protein
MFERGSDVVVQRHSRAPLADRPAGATTVSVGPVCNTVVRKVPSRTRHCATPTALRPSTNTSPGPRPAKHTTRCSTLPSRGPSCTPTFRSHMSGEHVAPPSANLADELARTSGDPTLRPWTGSTNRPRGHRVGAVRGQPSPATSSTQRQRAHFVRDQESLRRLAGPEHQCGFRESHDEHGGLRLSERSTL